MSHASYLIPIKTVTGLNAREHFRVRAKRVNAWLEDLGKKRPVSRLRRDYLDQVGKGNQGAWGDWR